MSSIQLIKQLRDMTQAGFLDCKKALEKYNDNLQEAVKYLREKGIAKASKKAGAIATEGATLVHIDGDDAVICEINCETDFSAANQHFSSLCEQIKVALVKANVETISQANELILSNGETLKTACESLSGKIGEKITLRRFVKLKKQANQDFSFYQHANKKYSSLILFDQKVDQLLGKNLAMHIVAHNPKFISSNHADQEWLKNEESIIEKQVLVSNKPKEFMQKIIQGKLNKLLMEVSLLDQKFDFDLTKKISQILKENNLQIFNFVRYELGEGIEKKENDFASEVAKQMG